MREEAFEYVRLDRLKYVMQNPHFGDKAGVIGAAGIWHQLHSERVDEG
jgi:hypothetical protein